MDNTSIIIKTSKENYEEIMKVILGITSDFPLWDYKDGELVGKFRGIPVFWEESKPWRANYNELYYFVVNTGVHRGLDHYTSYNDLHWHRGNYFKTREEAEQITKRIEGIFMKNRNK